MEEFFFIIWRGEIIGKLIKSEPDMWYLEGKFVSNNSPTAILFQELVLKFNASELIKDPKGATMVILKENLENENGTSALVLGIENELLFLRCVFDEKAIKMLSKITK